MAIQLSEFPLRGMFLLAVFPQLGQTPLYEDPPSSATYLVTIALPHPKQNSLLVQRWYVPWCSCTLVRLYGCAVPLYIC